MRNEELAGWEQQYADNSVSVTKTSTVDVDKNDYTGQYADNSVSVTKSGDDVDVTKTDNTEQYANNSTNIN